MSYKFGSSLVPGRYHYGGNGLGILGSLIPSVGMNGPSYLYNDLTFPGDANAEVRGLILTPPGVGAWFAYEDGSFSFTGAPDGIYSIPYRVYANGSDMGTGTITITIGAGSTLYGSATIDSFDTAGEIIGNLTSDLTGNATLDSFGASGLLASLGTSALSGDATLASFAAAGLVAGGQTLNLNQDYPGWVVRSYSRGRSLGRP